MTVTIYRWRQKAGGADFPARYLLTDKGGIRVDAGFSAEGGAQKPDMALTDCALAQEKRKALRRIPLSMNLLNLSSRLRLPVTSNTSRARSRLGLNMPSNQNVLHTRSTSQYDIRSGGQTRLLK